MKEYILDKFYYLKRWYSRVISEKYYNIKYGISNLIHWLPVVWEDRGWDFSYMFCVWEKKFDLMIKSFERGRNHVCGCDKQIKRMKICKEICRRLKDDWFYHENTFMFHDKKMGRA